MQTESHHPTSDIFRPLVSNCNPSGPSDVFEPSAKLVRLVRNLGVILMADLADLLVEGQD